MTDLTPDHMRLQCEICGPENDCICGGCQCKWCRHSRGNHVSPFEQAQIDAQARQVTASGFGRKLRDYQEKLHDDEAAD